MMTADLSDEAQATQVREARLVFDRVLKCAAAVGLEVKLIVGEDTTFNGDKQVRYQTVRIASVVRPL